MFLAISAYKKYSANKRQKKSIKIKDNLEALESQGTGPSNTASRLANETIIDVTSDPNHNIRLKRREERRSEEKEFQKAIMKRQIIRIGTLVFIDVVLPLSLYFALRNHINVTAALIISGIPPLLNVIYTFIRKRKIDALGCLFVFSFILSGVLSLVTGNARIALLRESAVTGVLCILFFITNIPITTPWFVNRPLVYLIAQELYSEQPPLRWVDTNRTEQQQPKTEWLWEKYKPFKIYCYVSSLMWSIGLGGEFLSRVLMVECTTLTIDEIVKYGVIIVATISSVLGVITVVSSAMIRKRANEYIDNWMDENDHYELLALNEAETINKD